MKATPALTASATFKSNDPTAPALPKGYRKHTGAGKMRDACPGCSVSDGTERMAAAGYPRGFVFGCAGFRASYAIEVPHCADKECESLLEDDGRCAHCDSGWEDESYKAAPRIPCWTCNNCGHRLPRVERRCKAEMMAARAGFASVHEYMVDAMGRLGLDVG